MAEDATIEEAVDEEAPRAPTEIRFTKNARQEYCERFGHVDFVDCQDGFEEYKEMSLEKEIRRKGVWYLDEREREGIDGENYLCIVNTLKVMRAIRKPGGHLLITTCYPHNKGLRGYVSKKMERCKELDEEVKIGTQWEIKKRG